MSSRYIYISIYIGVYGSSEVAGAKSMLISRKDLFFLLVETKKQRKRENVKGPSRLRDRNGPAHTPICNSNNSINCSGIESNRSNCSLRVQREKNKDGYSMLLEDDKKMIYKPG